MTITALFETGWELADSRDELTANTANYAVTTASPKTGTYSFALHSASGTGNYYEHSSGISQCQVAGHIRHAQTTGTRDYFVLRNGTTNVVRVRWNADTSSWTIVCGATTVATVSDPTFATINTYYHIGVDIKIDATAGWVYLYRDGVEIVSFDGDTNDGFASFNRLHPGNIDLGVAWASTALLDDLVWFDTTGELAPAAIPDYRLYAIAPTGNGNYNEWDGSDGNAVNNFEMVDEIPANDDTDYLTTLTANDTESFTMSTFAIPAGFAVEEVIPVAIARKTDALGALGLKLGTRLSATDQLSTTKALGTGYALYRERQTQTPAAANWLQADIDGLEVIIEAAA
jgi:hypothetical protein